MARAEGFAVNPAALSEAGAGIGRLLQDLNESVRLKPIYPAAVFGHAELAASAEQFADQWQAGAARLVGDAESMHRRLGETVAEYLRVEGSVVDRLRGRDDR